MLLNSESDDGFLQCLECWVESGREFFWNPLVLLPLILLLIFSVVMNWFSIVRLLFRFRNSFRPRQAVPPPTDPLLLISATETARRIRMRELKSEDLVRSYIARIAEVNDMINALVETNEEALAQARAVDARLDQASAAEIEQIARTQPFLGVPISIKECIEMEGYKCSIGIKARQDFISSTTAPVVDNLRNAGCIVLGKTNVPEICLSFYTTNQVYGRTSNPYDTRRVSGGSSGGEGALISAAGSVMGVGSDICGSVRFPAHFNGIFGLKTSIGLVDVTGHLPVISEFRSKMLSLGPLCRYAEDLEGMTRAMAGENAHKIRLGEPIDESTIKLFFMTDLGDFLVEKCCPETLSTVKTAVSALEERFGVEAEELRFECTSRTIHLIAASMHSDTQPPVKRILTNWESDVNPAMEMIRLVFGKKEYTYPSLFVSCLEEYYKYSEETLKKLRNERDQLAIRIREILGPNGYLVCPSFPTAAPFHDQSAFSMFNFGYAGLFNIISLPSVQCPVNLSSDGLPIGVQIVGPDFSDGALIEIAKEMEKLFGGWRAQKSDD